MSRVPGIIFGGHLFKSFLVWLVLFEFYFLLLYLSLAFHCVKHKIFLYSQEIFLCISFSCITTKLKNKKPIILVFCALRFVLHSMSFKQRKHVSLKKYGVKKNIWSVKVRIIQVLHLAFWIWKEHCSFM